VDFEVENKTFLTELNQLKSKKSYLLENTNSSIIEFANLVIALSSKTLCNFKKQIIATGFKSISQEIKFFKEIKQSPLLELIYFSEVRSFEIQFPRADEHLQLKCIKKKLSKINRFFLYNIEFGRYVDSGATHFDKEYFTRDYLEKFHITTSKFYFQDPEFCTPRDMLLGKYIAYDLLVVYLDEKKHRIKKGWSGMPNIAEPMEKIQWPFSNTDYVELVYALCSKGLGKQDNQAIIQVSKKLQQLFDIEPKDIYKTYQYIKNRKNSRTLFLDELSTSLLLEMDKSEE